MEKLGTIYALRHPITDEYVYIGQTFQKINRRINQHKNPSKKNKTPIAKFVKKYERYILKFDILLSEVMSSEDLNSKEVYFIEKFSKKNNLLNIESGGNNAPISKEARIKCIESRNRNNVWKPLKGEDNGNSTLTERQVRYIYTLIKKYRSNEEIFRMCESFGVSVSTIKSLRSGII